MTLRQISSFATKPGNSGMPVSDSIATALQHLADARGDLLYQSLQVLRAGPCHRSKHG